MPNHAFITFRLHRPILFSEIKLPNSIIVMIWCYCDCYVKKKNGKNHQSSIFHNVKTNAVVCYTIHVGEEMVIKWTFHEYYFFFLWIFTCRFCDLHFIDTCRIAPTILSLYHSTNELSLTEIFQRIFRFEDRFYLLQSLPTNCWKIK